MDEDSYIRGERSAHAGMLAHCCRALGYDDLEVQKANWIVEREAVIAALRDVCAEHGDNDWHVSLHLADVITKHLQIHLPGGEYGRRQRD